MLTFCLLHSAVLKLSRKLSYDHNRQCAMSISKLEGRPVHLSLPWPFCRIIVRNILDRTAAEKRTGGHPSGTITPPPRLNWTKKKPTGKPPRPKTPRHPQAAHSRYFAPKIPGITNLPPSPIISIGYILDLVSIWLPIFMENYPHALPSVFPVSRCGRGFI